MARLDWCKRQKHGVKKVEPSDNIAQDYIKNAEESLQILGEIKDTRSKIWIATIRYYIEYFAFYSIMMRLGIKSEIHDCTIEVASFLEGEGVIDEDVVETLEKGKELRIENQYYLKGKTVDFDMDRLRDFILKMKDVKDNLSPDQITDIRRKLFKC